jgi:hypothetical protein
VTETAPAGSWEGNAGRGTKEKVDHVRITKGRHERQVSITGRVFENDWRTLLLPELDNRITQIRRSAVRQHLSQEQWKQLDRMRRHLVKLNAEATPAREVFERNTIS